MRALVWMVVSIFVLCLVLPAAAGKGYMGGSGSVTVAEEPVVVEEPVVEEAPPDTGGLLDTVEGPLNDKMSNAGKLFGDLYKILRQQGVAGDKKLVAGGMTATADAYFAYGDYAGTYQALAMSEQDAALETIVGGEPVLTVIDRVEANNFSDYGWYAVDTDDDGVGDTAARSPFPAMCVQPVANYARWGDISTQTGLTKNRLPLVITYDATWNRSECAVAQLTEDPSVDETGSLNLGAVTNPYFVEPGGSWYDPSNGLVTYPDGVLWTDLIEEVGFGRLNISRSPEAVLQSSFDEAINNLNSPDTIAIERDAAGRLLLTKNVYDPILVDPTTGEPLLMGTVKKAIDSPLENVALYVKLMKDGHLVTPGDERTPLDRSKNGGIPLWKMLELSDGPGAKALRPTIDIAKLRTWGMGNLVDVSEVEYLTYYICLDEAGAEVDCMIWGTDPSPEVTEPVLVGNPAAATRELITVSASGGCPGSGGGDNPYICEGPFTGIMTDDGGAPDGEDLDFAAATFAAAADKTGHVSVDMLVYLNSILGINQVLGYSEYDADGNPTADAVDYEKNPAYFNFNKVFAYNRNGTFGARGQVTSTGGGVDQAGASTYDGKVTVLQGASPNWTETAVPILDAETDGDLNLGNGVSIFDVLGMEIDTGFPNGSAAANNIFGFTQQADDDLSVIRFIHTYQIPGLR